jgi:hypothetical protein
MKRQERVRQGGRGLMGDRGSGIEDERQRRLTAKFAKTPRWEKGEIDFG